MISINVTPTGTQPPEGSVSSAVVNDKIDKKIESFKTETFDAPLVTAPVGDEVIPVKRPDESFGTIQINQLGSGTSTGSLIEATYDELVSWADSGKLIPGQKYRMIDYETIVEGDDIRSAGHHFDLIVTALNETTLDKKCSAAHSVRDTEGYFLNSDLSSWEIYYTLDSGFYSHVPRKGKGVVIDILRAGEEYSMYYITLICKKQSDGTFLWSGSLNAADVIGYTVRLDIITEDDTLDSAISATICVLEEGMCETLNPSEVGQLPIVKEFNNEVGGTGYIYRLTDEFNNSCPYDFKNIQYLISLANIFYGDNTGLSNGWKFNYLNTSDASDQWVYTFNRQDLNRLYHDVSLNYNQGDLSCKNNYMYDSSSLPKNIILTSDYEAQRDSDGAPEAERAMNNNYFGELCFNNIFNVCSDTTFKCMCTYNYGTKCMNNTLEEVTFCVFGHLNGYYYIKNNSFYSCSDCDFSGDCENNQIKHAYNLKSNIFNDNIVYNIRDVYGLNFEGCTITNLLNVKNDGSTSINLVNCTLDIDYTTINNIDGYYTSIYNSNIKGHYCDLKIYNNNIRYNLDVILWGSSSKRINHSFKNDAAGLKYINDYKTYVRAKKDGTVYEYTDLDLFNQGGSSAVVEALNTEI